MAHGPEARQLLLAVCSSTPLPLSLPLPARRLGCPARTTLLLALGGLGGLGGPGLSSSSICKAFSTSTLPHPSFPPSVTPSLSRSRCSSLPQRTWWPSSASFSSSRAFHRTARLPLPTPRSSPDTSLIPAPVTAPSTGLINPARFWKPTDRSVILTDYEDLPADYKDTKGLPFSARPLPADKTRGIFGDALPPHAANRLLRIVHGRRVAGTLDEPRLAGNVAAFPDGTVETALRWLRNNVRCDEIMNAGLRAQDELDELDRAYHKSEAAAGRADPLPDPDPLYGDSGLDVLRARRGARLDREDRERREARKAKGLAEDPPGPVELFRNRPLSPQMQKWTALAQSDQTEPPELTYWERLGPSVAFTAATVAAFSALALFYEPPDPDRRLFPNVSPAAATVGALLLVNAAAFAAWSVPPAWRLMNRYFVVVYGDPKPVSLLTAPFSHIKLSHLLLNLFTLAYFGTAAHDDIGGRATTVALYVGSGMCGFVGSMAYFTARGALGVSSLGGSGATFGVAAAYFWLHKLDYFKVLGFPPDPMDGVPGIAFLAVLLGLNFGTVSRMMTTQVDKVSHLCGILFGIAFAEVRTRRAERLRVEAAAETETAAVASSTTLSTLPTSPTSSWKVVDLIGGAVSTKTGSGSDLGDVEAEARRSVREGMVKAEGSSRNSSK